MWSIIRTSLAVLNVLGALAFFWLAAKDYGARQSWAYSVLLHDVAVRGLPLNNEELDADNYKIVERLGEEGKKDVFAGQAGPVATQLEEVVRVKLKLDGAIAAAASDKRAQAVALAHILIPLTVSESQREQLLAIQTYLLDAKAADQLKADITRAAVAAKDEKRKPPKAFDLALTEELEALPGPSRKPFEEAYLAEQKKSPDKKPEALFDDSIDQIRQNLQKSYDEAFAAAQSGNLNGNPMAISEQKALIASLLFNVIEPMSEIETQQAAKPGQAFDLALGPYKRYLAVVGLEAAIKAIQQESRVLARMTDDLRLEMNRTQTIFVTSQQDLVNQLQEAAAKDAELTEALAREKDLVAKHQALVNRRKEDIKLFSGELAKLSKETADRLSEVRMMNDELYKIRVATRNATEANQTFEQKIQTLEAGK